MNLKKGSKKLLNGSKMIEGVNVKQLKIVPDDRGRLMELLRADDSLFKKFGQVYLTTARPGVIKAWHYHKKQTDNFAAIKGMIQLVLYDCRKNSKTFKRIQEFFIGDFNPLLVQIPPYVFHGFKCISEKETLVINIPTEVYNYSKPDEFRVDPFTNKIPYSWKTKSK